MLMKAFYPNWRAMSMANTISMYFFCFFYTLAQYIVVQKKMNLKIRFIYMQYAPLSVVIYKTPFVERTSVILLSKHVAISRAFPNALNIASIIWWSFSPYSTFRWRFIPAE